jgi:quinol monooxygenase YgiN
VEEGAVARVSVLTKLVAADGKIDELLAQVEGLVAATHAEPGTEVYVVNRARDDPNTLFVYEVFVDRQAFKDHASRGDAMRGVLAPLLARTEFLFGEPLSGKGITI